MTEEDAQDLVLSLADAAVEHALTFGRNLDFSRESIDTVEEMLDYYHGLLNGPEGRKPTERQIDSIAMSLGVYIGEVMRKKVGPDCVWVREDVFGDGNILHLRLHGKAVRAFPLDKALKRMQNGPRDHIRPFFDLGVKMFIRETKVANR